MVWGVGLIMNSQNLNRIKQLSVEYFKQGLYCSEAVLKAFEDVTGYRFSDDFKRTMTILGEGIGECGCICGAVSSAILIAGHFTGRVDVNQDREYAQKVGKKIIDQFKSQYQTTCCKTLKKRSEIIFGIGQYRHCPEMTSFCSELIYKLAIEEGWIKEDRFVHCR